MIVFDLQTGETYRAIIYRDDQVAVLWSLDPGTAQPRESQISAGQLASVTTWPSDMPAFAARLARYQVIGDDAGEIPAAAAERREALGLYAEANGGQISVHQQQERPAGLAGLARRGRNLFAGRAR